MNEIDDITLDLELDSAPPAAAKADPSDADGAMSKYFRDISEHRVLTPEEETALAQDIEALEIEVWKRLFSYGPVARYLAARLERDLEEPPVRALRALARAAARAGSRPNKQARAALERAADRAARAVRPLDLDKDLLKAVMADLERHAERGAKAGDIPVSGASRTYQRYVAYVRQAADAAASAREAFVRANLRLVISIARRYAKGPMSLADLIQEGNLGLLKAVDRFDHRRGFRFSTYASWWIRHAVGRALADRGREVRVPVHMVDAGYRLKKARRELLAKLGRDPTEKELADAVDMPVAKLRQMSTLLLGHPVSMNQPVGGDDERSLIDVFQDPAAEESTPDEQIDKETISRALREVMLDLSSIETDVVRRRFGLDGEREHTLQEIADEYQRSRERIRQIQAGALRKMRVALSRRNIRAA
ncbi:MAG: RNA polymerase sigma factor RpoD/SigA [Deltaproteobacteria bacterium]|nr:MAG: RNA polymerase sigma factor RpoD/SigA [Deltaproteobacteria bacterium]